jgi:hypothetical protein
MYSTNDVVLLPNDVILLPNAASVPPTAVDEAAFTGYQSCIFGQTEHKSHIAQRNPSDGPRKPRRLAPHSKAESGKRCCASHGGRFLWCSWMLAWSTAVPGGGGPPARAGAQLDALLIRPRATARYGRFSPPSWDCAVHGLLIHGAHTPGRRSTRTWQACRSGAQGWTHLYVVGWADRVQIPASRPQGSLMTWDSVRVPAQPRPDAHRLLTPIDCGWVCWPGRRAAFPTEALPSYRAPTDDAQEYIRTRI